MQKKKSTYEMAEEVKGHPVVVRMQKDDINDTELIAIMDEYLHTPTPVAMRTLHRVSTARPRCCSSALVHQTSC